jgi:hypothetical protein
MLAAGDTPEVILQGYPCLEIEDIQACLIYARKLVCHENDRPLFLTIMISLYGEGTIIKQRVRGFYPALSLCDIPPFRFLYKGGGDLFKSRDLWPFPLRHLVKGPPSA